MNENCNSLEEMNWFVCVKYCANVKDLFILFFSFELVIQVHFSFLCSYTCSVKLKIEIFHSLASYRESRKFRVINIKWNFLFRFAKKDGRSRNERYRFTHCWIKWDRMKWKRWRFKLNFGENPTMKRKRFDESIVECILRSFFLTFSLALLSHQKYKLNLK